MEAEPEAGHIVQLEETVINRIAAGEVVVRPANALKELLENSLDAGSQRVVVALKAGGLKMLRIEDDGHGIRQEDLPILCERFTTSKLRKYEDLTSIGTFGFRGEALASISHVGHVTVTTMTARDSCAHVAQYSDGRLRAPPRPCAGTRGTTLVVEDLFYNNQTRRQALGKDSVEHAKVLEVVQKYAIHYPQVSFICRKAAGAVAELHTPGGPEATSWQAVSVVQGSALASQLFEFQAASEEPRFSCRGLATGPQWTTRSCSLTLFINNRLVECAPLRRAIEAVYVPVLPRHQHPWIYLALDLDPATVDVNVHPTKSEVQFLHEEAIAQQIQEALASRLKAKAGSRTFDSQTSLLAAGHATFTAAGTRAGASGASARQSPPPLAGSMVMLSAQTSVLVASAGGADCREVTMEALGTLVAGSSGAASSSMVKGHATLGEGPAPLMDVQDLQPSQRQQPPTQQQHGPKRVDLNPTRIRTDHRQRSLESVWRGSTESLGEALESPPLQDAAAADPQAPAGSPPGVVAAAAAGAPPGRGARPAEDEETRRAAFRDAQQLTSIAELRANAQLQEVDREFSKGLNHSVYVGPVSRDLVLLQCGGSLCLANLTILAREFAYQRLLRLFGGVGRITLRQPLPVEALLRLGIQDPGSGYDHAAHADVDVPGLVAQFAALLDEKAEMLTEYFMLDIVDGMLTSLPNALGMSSDTGLKFDEVPLFLVRLCVETDWTEENACFEGLCRLTAQLAVELLLPTEEEAARCMAASAGAGSAQANAAALSAAVEAGDFPDVAAAAAAAKCKRARTAGQHALQELRYLHEAIRNAAAAAGVAGACRWPGSFKKDGTVVNLVALEQLYKIFERC